MPEEKATLLQRGQSGDRDALQELLAGQQERLYALCLRWTRNPADAEDLAQETLLRGCACLSQLQNSEALSAWLTRIALNIFRNWLAREKQTPLPLEFAEWEKANAGETDETTLERLTVQAALDRLSPELRLAIRLFYLHGLTQNELAALWHLPASTVKGRLDSGRQQMRKELERMGMQVNTTDMAIANTRETEIALPKTRIAITDVNPVQTKALRLALRSDDFTISVISSEELLLHRLRRQPPDILILNAPFGTLDENDALRTLRLDQRLRHIAVIFVVPRVRATDARLFQAWELGVDCFLTDPTNATEIASFARRIDAVRRAADYRTLAIEYAWRRDSARTLVCLHRVSQLGGKEALTTVRDDSAFNYLRGEETFQELFA